MFKILLSIIIAITVANSQEMGKNGGGCTLAQEGDFKVGYNEVAINGAKYFANAPSGKNFREIFVGSKLVIDNENPDNVINAEILDYKPNKRMRGKPKTGLFIVKISMKAGITILPMEYVFDAGIMKANAVINSPFLKEKASLKIWFETAVKYSLCYVEK